MQIAKNYPGFTRTKLLRVMKLVAVFLLAACLQVSAKGYTQKVTLDLRNVGFEKVFKEIKRQTGFLFLYNSEEIKKIGRVSITISNADVSEVLEKSLSPTGFTYKIVDKTIILSPKPVVATPVARILSPGLVDITGTITDENG